MARTVKRLPAMQETWVRSLGGEDPLEKEMCNPLQYSCLGNPMDGGAWWATVHRVAKSRTQLSDFTFSLWLLQWWKGFIVGLKLTWSMGTICYRGKAFRSAWRAGQGPEGSSPSRHHVRIISAPPALQGPGSTGTRGSHGKSGTCKPLLTFDS